MNYRRLYIMRKDLNMSAGKISAQVGHCSEAYWLSLISNGFAKCDLRGGTVDVTIKIPREVISKYVFKDTVKTICQAKNKNHLLKAIDMAIELGLHEGEDYGLIYDKCFTELTPEEEDGTTLTGVWFRPLPDELAHKISSKYHLYMG